MGEGVVLRIKVEQNDEVCFEAKVGEKAGVLLVSLWYNTEDLNTDKWYPTKCSP